MASERLRSDRRPRRRPPRRFVARLAGAALLVALAWDLTRPPAAQWTARVELAAIAAYRRELSAPLGRSGLACRFTPSCSRFAEQAIRRQGALVGSARAAWRVVRCGPWTPAGTSDPP